ncbi:uncharacterized protein LOC127708280 [Mytilus californianus]|uniref:uncharacterized protein LOC127708280 n=1 Tax=Mytilus californianus TaxID=6549 RepID=UPI002245A369|nr:uncharacterized protein LOC127708280 [Mytilus californianus]
MTNLLCNILRATFIVPFSAGLIKERRNGGFSIHDGSIAGVVLLTTAMIIIFEIIVVLPVNQSRLLMVGLSGLALICLVLCSIVVRCRSTWVEVKTVKPSDQMKLKFLWLFCIGNITYQALQLATHLLCKIYNLQVTLFWTFTWTFQICQTAFIHYFSRFKFANVLCLYYGLLVLCVTNISMWTQQTFYTNRIRLEINISDLINNTISNCLYGDGLATAVGFLNPYLQPVLLEYSLLSLIFLSEMWPKKNAEFETLNNSLSRSRDDENQTLLVENDDQDGEHHPLLPRCSVWHKNSVCVLVIGFLYNFSFMLIQCIYIYGPREKMTDYRKFSFDVFFCANIVRTPLIIKCFYALNGQLRSKQESHTGMSLDQFVIITSSFATCGLYIADCFRLSDSPASTNLGEILFKINVVLRVVATLFQTLFILQMKHYKKIGDQKPFCSVQNTFLFVSLVNLGIWMSYTFVTPRYRLTKSSFLLESFWFPFVLFYHFECFVAFYKFFRA